MSRLTHLLGGLLAASAGTSFFFVIIGVFGVPASLVAAIGLIAIAVALHRRTQQQDR